MLSRCVISKELRVAKKHLATFGVGRPQRIGEHTFAKAKKERELAVTTSLGAGNCPPRPPRLPWLETALPRVGLRLPLMTSC
jgi:hypothetical protein